MSICIPAYNAEKTMMSTLQSIANQTYHNIELLVVDDASTDNTLSRLQQINEPRLVIHKNERNIGCEANFTRCIRLTSGEYIAKFDADDLFMPNMIEKQVQTFQDNPTIGAVFTLANLINEKDEVIGETNLPIELRGKGIYHFPEIFISILENGNFLVGNCMVRGELYQELVPFDEDRFGKAADFDMWLRILEKHPVAILEERLMSYRLSNTQDSYLYQYLLRTEQAEYFKVMDYYLGIKSNVLDIPRRVLNKYEFQRSMDKLRCAENYVIKGQPQEAKKFLKESFSTTVFRGVMGSINKPEILANWIIGMMLLVLVYLGLGRYLGKSLHWWLYTWKRRKI
ncbi:glycosyltransferase family 2 protein [Chloroflexota bacterium]